MAENMWKNDIGLDDPYILFISIMAFKKCYNP